MKATRYYSINESIGVGAMYVAANSIHKYPESKMMAKSLMIDYIGNSGCKALLLTHQFYTEPGRAKEEQHRLIL